MNLDDGAVHRNRLKLDTHYLLSLQIFEYPVESPILRPPVHPGVDGVPVAESIRQPPPLAALLGDIQDCVERLQVRQTDVAALDREDRCDALVLSFGNFHSLIVTRLG